ncbi:DUF2393 domain-containing protein [Campylobacter peloridis]|uniref:DUF2393 domain-containing protein n=1 Tax=Campylobacter peloridis TaxID=488546 RepID=A0A5C7DQI9_9BACT|nr:DUF2393 family protein [Campylobacter peloridis]TXE83219.1 DUF2393 domain-containing protein [Campylobacter peloridis]
MNAQKIREQILFYISHLQLIDFLVIVLVVFFFIATLFIALFIRHKANFAFIVIFLGILCSISMAFLGYFLIDNIARSRIVNIDYYKYFTYDNSLSIEYSLKNTSKNNFQYCKISISVHKKPTDDSKIQKILYSIKPIRSKSTILEKTIKPDQTINLRTKISDFKSEENFEIKINSKCF